jgi:hypothetical protein
VETLALAFPQWTNDLEQKVTQEERGLLPAEISSPVTPHNKIFDAFCATRVIEML